MIKLDFVESIAKKGTVMLNIFPVKKNKIYFRCFDGDRYGFDQRAILEYILENYPDEYDLYWETAKNSKIKLPKGVERVDKFSLSQVFHLKTSQYVIYNISVPAFIGFREKQCLVNTWHGFGIKGTSKQQDDAKNNMNRATFFTSCSDYYSRITVHNVLGYNGPIVPTGFPRNDVLLNNDKKQKWREKIRRAYNVPANAKLIIYSPTFRKNFEYEDMNLDYSMLLASLKEKFGAEWYLLERKHPMIHSNSFHCQNRVINVSKHEDMQELLCAADAMVSDYSGCIWDFALTGNPVFLFVPDVEDYINDRGFVIDLSMLPYKLSKSNEELEIAIHSFNPEEYENSLKAFYRYVINYDNGGACEKLVDYIRNWCTA